MSESVQTARFTILLHSLPPYWLLLFYIYSLLFSWSYLKSVQPIERDIDLSKLWSGLSKSCITYWPSDTTSELHLKLTSTCWFALCMRCICSTLHRHSELLLFFCIACFNRMSFNRGFCILLINLFIRNRWRQTQ